MTKNSLKSLIFLFGSIKRSSRGGVERLLIQFSESQVNSSISET